MMQKKDPFVGTALVLFILLGLVFIYVSDHSAAAKDDADYCDKVAQHKLNNKTGWPAYKGDHCSER